MSETDEIKKLLIELRDIEREHLAKYRKAAGESLELQRQAVLWQKQAVKFSSRVIIFIVLGIICLIILLVYLRIENYITFV